MKKLLFIIFIFLLCMFSSSYTVNAEDMCTWPKDFNELTGIRPITYFSHETTRTTHKVGDKINVSFDFPNQTTPSTYVLDPDAKFELLLKSTTTNDIYSVYLENIKQGNRYHWEYVAYYTIPDNFAPGEYEYYGFNIKVNNKQEEQATENDMICKKYLFDSKNVEDNTNYSPSVIVISIAYSQYETVKVVEEYPAERDVLKSISLATKQKEYYLGGKLTFNVELAEEINHITVYLKGPSFFYMSLFPECPANNKTKCTATGYIPRTMPGYVATQENGRTEWVINEGTYEIGDITVYDGKGSYINYTNDSDKAIDSNALYINYEKTSFNIKEPTSDELNDVNFLLDKFTFKKQTAAIGSPVSLDVKYSYEDSNKKVKSIYLIFRDSAKKRTFTTTIKSLLNNPYFIIASSADLATYKLDGIGVTFEAKDGTNNTIILNDASNNGKYSEIFSQTLVITEQEDNGMLYLSAEELDAETYQQILNSNDETVIVEADNYTIIPGELFSLIKKNTKKLIIRYNENEWVFNGIDIENPKNIDVFMNFYEMNESNISDNLKKALDGETVILEFPNNGELPGDVLIRIKKSAIDDKLTGNEFYIYYADTENDKLKTVALGVQETADGYIEFYINHNSKYVISSKEITNKEILGEDDSSMTKNIELKKETGTISKNTIMLYIIIAVTCILIVITLIAIIKKNNKKATNESNNSQINENN